ncbi:MAG: TonB-linked outer membrane protein, SusC/RagA family [Bacteroidetes bacterium]|nr:TonB-linked outer membrane protein, SusC/RagA family [Bacteroidota bacterium]
MKKRLIFVMFILFSLGKITAQNISGVVRDANSEPLPGVTVTLKGTGIGTITDLNGKFIINGQHVIGKILSFSFVGYQSVEKLIEKETAFTITLQEASKNLEEVVVVGYGTQKKKDLTTAVSTVKSGDIADRPLVSAAQALQGMAAGVQVTENSGKPGSGLSVRVRGTTSINANNEPLYIIDGIPTSDTRNLPVDDIESLQVLKDASSAAIYGSRAANGVVLITTKHGKAGTSKITLNSYYGFSSLPKKIDVLNSTQFISLMGDLGYDTSILSSTTNTDWQNEVYRTAPILNTQVSFSGGSEKTQYYVSLGMLDQSGIIDPTQFKRYSLKINLDQEMKKWLKIGTNFSWSKVNSNDVTDNAGVAKGGVVLGALTTPPTMSIYNSDGTFTSNPYQAGWSNPVAYMKAISKNAKSDKLLSNIYAELSLMKDLKFKTAISIENNNYLYTSFTDPYSTSDGVSKKGIGIAETKRDLTWLTENTLTYNFKINQKHKVGLMAGTTAQKYDYYETYQEKTGYSGNSITTLTAASTTVSNNSEPDQWSMVSFFGRATYDFASKYLATINVRQDGSSRFGPDSRWGTFPSISAGWRISDEKFMDGWKKFLDDMKIRVGYGIVGNQPSDFYAYYAKESSGGAYPFPEGAITAIQPTSSGNSKLKWESTNQINAGIDASFFNSRIVLSFDLYYKKTKDLIMSKNIPTQTGFSTQMVNVGNVSNKGLEININTRNLVKKFKWNTDFNFALNRNKVLNLDGQTLYTGEIYERGNASIIKEGEPIGSFYGYISEGVDPATGMIKYKTDADGNKIQTIIGCAQPKFTFGLNNSFSYKNFDLGILLQCVYGNDILNATRIETEGMENYKNQTTAVLRRWKKAGDVTDIPAAIAGNTDNSQISTRFIEDGSFLRLKSVSLAYNLKNNFLQKCQISSIKLYVTAQNLATFTKYKGYDPELSFGGSSSDASTANAALGIDYGTYPQPRTIIFGMNIDF